MNNLRDKIQLTMRKCKTHSTTLNASMLKDKEIVQDFVQKNIGYKFIKTLQGSPP